MLAHLRRSVILCVVVLALTFAYAYAGTGIAQVFFKHQADGSITPNGSTLIGQAWSDTRCPGHPLGSCVFQGRPDATGPYASVTLNPNEHPGDDPLVESSYGGKPIDGESGGTSLGPRSQELLTYTKELVAYWHKRGVDPTPDLVTTSGSGYDPDISAEDAVVQIPMVSAATGLSRSVLTNLIHRETMGTELGFLGTSYIDVLQLNEALVKLEK